MKLPASLRAGGLVALIGLIGVTHINAASIYKTYDDQGNVVFTDQPADQASAELLATPSVNVADPLPVAPQTRPLIPATGTPALVGVTPNGLDANAAVPQATAQAVASPGTSVTAPVTQSTQQTESTQPVNAAASPATSNVPAAGQPEAGVDAVASTARTPEIANEQSLSERVATPVLPEGARPPVIGASEPSAVTSISINWPTPDEIVLSTQSPIWLELNSQPSSLKALGLKAEVWIDDQLSVSGVRPLLPLTLPEIGMHKLQVRLVDSQGNSVAESDSQLMDVRLGASQNR